MRRVIMVLLMIVYPLLASAQDAASLRAGVVKIKSTLNNKSRTGSGFVVAVDGSTTYIVTAAHVVEGDANPKVEFFGRQNTPINAEVVKQESRVDLAVLKVQGAPQSTPLAFESAAKPKVGDEVVAFGFPQGGGSWLMSKADIAGREGLDLIVSGAAIDQGNSGGPLIKDSKVVGVVQALQGKFARAAPASMVIETLEGWGIALKPAPTNKAATGETPAGAPAESASFEPSGTSQFTAIHQAAQNGNVQAMAALVDLYGTGVGVQQNFAEAAKWSRRAADAGNAQSQFIVGTIHLMKAVGRANDDATAVRLLSSAATTPDFTLQAIDTVQVKDWAELKLAERYYNAAALQGDTASASALIYTSAIRRGRE